MTYEGSEKSTQYSDHLTDLFTGWTLHENIQPYIDIYCSQETFIEVQRAFPYLVSKEFASGGGDVSARSPFYGETMLIGY